MTRLAVPAAALAAMLFAAGPATGDEKGGTEKMGKARVEWGEFAKSYPGADVTKLPRVRHSGMSVEKAIAGRRSVRQYHSRALAAGELSLVVFAACGKTGPGKGTAFRAAPSAGATYPLELYVVVNKVEGIAPGLYHYSVADHALELVRSGDLADEAREASWGQDSVGECAAFLVLAAVPERCERKYGENCSRYIPMEAGHIVQNVSLAAVSLGLGTVAIGAFEQGKMDALLGVDGRKEHSLYAAALGPLSAKRALLRRAERASPGTPKGKPKGG